MTNQRYRAIFLLCLALSLTCGVSSAVAEMKAEFWPLVSSQVEVEIEPVVEEMEQVIAAHIGARGEAITDAATGMAFVPIAQGCFQMGSEKGAANTKPKHKVCVEDYYLGQYEVTQEQWLAIMDDNPAYFADNANYPVERVSWDDVQTYIEKLNQRSDGHYRLPTEAEWEYAARAGQDTDYSGGDEADEVAWSDRNSDNTVHGVGEKLPNAFGFYDMSGNVWEWCSDRYSDSYYGDSVTDNPQGPDDGDRRVYRGGSWQDYVWTLTTTVRAGGKENYRYPGLGFRLVYSPAQ